MRDTLVSTNNHSCSLVVSSHDDSKLVKKRKIQDCGGTRPVAGGMEMVA